MFYIHSLHLFHIYAHKFYSYELRVLDQWSISIDIASIWILFSFFQEFLTVIKYHLFWLIKKKKTANSPFFTSIHHHSIAYLVLIVFRTHFELMEFSTYTSCNKHLPLLIYWHILWSSSIFFFLFYSPFCCAPINHIMFKYIHLHIYIYKL
jgi:hypothetical protein